MKLGVFLLFDKFLEGWRRFQVWRSSTYRLASVMAKIWRVLAFGSTPRTLLRNASFIRSKRARSVLFRYPHISWISQLAAGRACGLCRVRACRNWRSSSRRVPSFCTSPERVCLMKSLSTWKWCPRTQTRWHTSPVNLSSEHTYVPYENVAAAAAIDDQWSLITDHQSFWPIAAITTRQSLKQFYQNQANGWRAWWKAPI